MKINELHPSKYLKASDLDGEAQVVMDRVTIERMKNQEGEEEEKPILYFRGIEKGLVLNPTNRKRIEAQHPAEDTDEWRGKRITLVKEWVEAFGKADWAIRIKVVAPVGKSGGGALLGGSPATEAAGFGGDDVPV